MPGDQLSVSEREGKEGEEEEKEKGGKGVRAVCMCGHLWGCGCDGKPDR